jgi:hypothetical protein
VVGWIVAQIEDVRLLSTRPECDGRTEARREEVLKRIERVVMIQLKLTSWEEQRLCVQMECGGEGNPLDALQRT